ncbi:MAG TPA: SURF1 family protein [Euzebyales bacterium]|nr:SURF1 family protein [Euzebyales bacterium]
MITFVNRGFWQLRRLDERRAYNGLVTQRLDAAPVPLDELVGRVGPDPRALVFRRVVVGGRYRPEGQLLTAPRSRDGRPGPQVLTVLDTDGGAPVLVDRGWIPFERDTVPPAPPPGRVQVEGIVRAPEPGAAGTAEQVVRIVPRQIGERSGLRLPAYYVELWGQRPDVPATGPLPGRRPELIEGSHQSYALQWFAFALIALIGYPVLVWRTVRGGPDGGTDRPEAQADGAVAGPDAAPGDRPADDRELEPRERGAVSEARRSR